MVPYSKTIIILVYEWLTMNAAALFTQLKTLRDKLKLKSHLFEMELKEDWHSLEKKVHELESHLIQRARQLGVAEEHYYVGSDDEIKDLVDAMNTLKTRVDAQDSKNQ